MERRDLAVIGAGAAGMMCAAVAGQRGRSVVLLDHWSQPAEKIRISGGGRCNFTNTGTGPANFVSTNPTFCETALAAYSASDFIALVKRYRIPFHEKHRGQLFCDDSSDAIIGMLRSECASGRVSWRIPCKVQTLERHGAGFRIVTDTGGIEATKVVIATGGLSIPKIGASDFGYRIARQFQIKVIEPRPGLVPMTFPAALWAPFALLAGVSLPVSITAGVGTENVAFDEDLLFTHRGLSGPAVLQISSFWDPQQPLVINLCPGRELASALKAAKENSKSDLAKVLAEFLPRRVVETWLTTQLPSSDALGDRKIAEIANKMLELIATSLNGWKILPSGTEGFRKAEVTRGGVDTRQLCPSTMESNAVPGLYFIGEVLDVTGWLGGYNFQWAWASGVAAGRAA